MASLYNFNNSIIFNTQLSKNPIVFEDNKSDVFMKKPLNLANQHYYIYNQDKISTLYIPSINEQIDLLQQETEQLENSIKRVEISKHLKALKTKDLRNVIERISEEDYYDRFMDRRRLFTFEKQRKNSANTGKSKSVCKGGDVDCSAIETNEESGSLQEGISSNPDHLSNCILYWSQVITVPRPSSNGFRV